MNTAHRLALLCFLVAGCAVELGTDVSLIEFDRTPASVSVDLAEATVTCSMEINATGGRTVQYAACQFKSPDGRKAACLSVTPIGNVWSCAFTIPQDTEANTWTVDYIFAEDDLGNKMFVTGAELVADAANVLSGDATRVDLTVQSPNEDTDPPVLLSFSVLPASVDPGQNVTCSVGASDASPIKTIGCTFVPDDSSNSVSCVGRGVPSCVINIPNDADAGVTYNEVNHRARDLALNVAIDNDAASFSTSGGAWTPVDASEWPSGPDTDCTVGSTPIATQGACVCEGVPYETGYCLSTGFSFSPAPSSTVYVVPGGTGAQTGADWGNALAGLPASGA